MSGSGLDSFVAPPPWSAVISVLLIAGCDGLGLVVMRAFGLGLPGAPKWHRWQAGVIGAMTLAVVLYPLALVNLTTLTFMRAAAFIVAALGLVNAGRLIRKVVSRRRVAPRPNLRAVGAWSLLLALLLVGAALMALGPVTDADSLDYHMGVPVLLLKTGGMPVTPEWFHSRIAGSNEVLNALGLAAGAEALGAFLQVAGLIAIAGLLLFAEPSGGRSVTHSPRVVIAVAALSTPVLVALISQKPQLLPIAMTTLALALVTFPSRRELSGRAALLGHALVCLLVMSAAQAKFTYMLGGAVVGLISLFVMARRRLLWPALGVSVVAGALIFGPPVIWKAHVFHDGLINSLIRPVPGSWPGTETFEHYLRTFRDSVVPFPLSLILPSRATTISTIMGPAGLILLLALRPERDGWLWTCIAAAVFVAVASVFLGPSTSRSFLEPYFWLLMVVALQPDQASAHARWIRWPVFAQGVLTCALIWYGAAILLPGGLTARWRSMVMNRSANGYQIMSWADTVLPADAVMITTARSIALAPRDVVSLDWSRHVNPGSSDAVPYLQRLKERGVTHLLVTGSPPQLAGLGGCVGGLFAGPAEVRPAVRNPFSNPPTYQAWIYAFHSDGLPECAAGHH
jgi:Protein of unknown function (DUF1420)